MLPVARVGDVTYCWAYCHGDDCCCHSGPGINVSGDKTVLVNMSPVVRVGDTTSHSCPHCRTGTAMGSNPRVLSTLLPHHEVGHPIMEGCGIGVQVTASPNVIG